MLAAQVEALGFEPAEITFPDSLTEEMKGWLEDNVRRGLADRETIDRLLSALITPDGLGLVYLPGYTATAEEVFESGESELSGFHPTPGRDEP